MNSDISYDVPAEAVIEILKDRIGSLVVDNAILKVALSAEQERAARLEQAVTLLSCEGEDE